MIDKKDNTTSVLETVQTTKFKIKNSAPLTVKNAKVEQQKFSQKITKQIDETKLRKKQKQIKSNKFKHSKQNRYAKQDYEAQPNKIITTPNTEITRDMFKKNFKHYIEYLACSTIGDSNSYLKHLQKEQINNNLEANAQLEAIHYFETFQNKLSTIEHKIQLIGNERLLTLFKSVKDLLVPPDKIQNYWSVCAMTGMPSNQLLSLTPNFKIDSKYHASVTALWLCLHLQKVEQTRINTFAGKYTDSSFMSKIIHAYLEKEEAMSMCHVYLWAFKKCFDTFEYTFEALPEIIHASRVLTLCTEGYKSSL
jgi:hypothetical protein